MGAKASNYGQRARALAERQGYLITAWRGPMEIGSIYKLLKVSGVLIRIESSATREEYLAQGMMNAHDLVQDVHFYRCEVLLSERLILAEQRHKALLAALAGAMEKP